MKEAIAFTNCPKVSVEARFPPFITVETSGFNEVCISALPIPRSENDTSISPYDSPKTGSSNENKVMMRLSKTVFLRPILFINIPVGTEKMRNQKKTKDGKTLAVESVRCKSSFT